MLPLVALAGIAMNAYISLTLVLAQEYLPKHMGLATGLTIGLSSGVAGLVVALLGLLGDRAGAGAVLLAVAPLPLIAAALGAWLPQRVAAVSPVTVGDAVDVAVPGSAATAEDAAAPSA
jgi:FSR family fosmidomycin resistance protein-like MFS transporter